MLCDLHTHSHYSDGSSSPAEIIDLALAANLKAIALTDHNTTLGLKEFSDYAADKPIEAVTGIEISTDYKGRELHILALFIDPDRYPEIEAKLAPFKSGKSESNRCLAKALNKAGYEISYDNLLSATPDGNVNRAHFAAELVKRGYFATIQQCFEAVLDEAKGYYVPAAKLSAFDAIKFIHSLNAVAVLAHPFYSLKTEERLRGFLDDCKGLPLDGMETYYSLHDEATESLACKIADEYCLICSGGSDFHGNRKPDIQIGKGKGGLQIPDECYYSLKAKSLQKAAC